MNIICLVNYIFSSK